MSTQFPDRRKFLFTISAGAIGTAGAAVAARAQTKQDPWSRDELMSPADLAKTLATGQAPPMIICVTFPVLYRQRHIAHATLAGPGNKPEGLDELRKQTERASKDSQIVLYCGCCPMEKCPNVRPSYSLLKEHGFQNVRVLNLPTNFHTDWVVKGYPVET